MREFAHFKDQFEHEWEDDAERRKNFLSRIIGIIARRCNLSIGMILDRDGFKEAITVNSSLAEFYVNEYTAASFMSLMSTGRWADKYNHKEPISYVFDEGNTRRSDFERAFNKAKSVSVLRKMYRLGGLSFDDDKRVLPLQAADFIAWEIRKAYVDVANDERRLRRSLTSLMKNVIGDWKIGTKDRLVALAKQARVI